MENQGFKFAMGSRVKLIESDETGRVIGQARHENSEDQFNIRYVAGDGRQIESWWSASAIEAAKSPACLEN